MKTAMADRRALFFCPYLVSCLCSRFHVSFLRVCSFSHPSTSRPFDVSNPNPFVVSPWASGSYACVFPFCPCARLHFSRGPGLRLEHEEAAFDADRYLGDLFPEDEDPILAEALAFEPHWQRRLRAQRRRRRRQRLRQQRHLDEKLQTRDGGEAGGAEEKGGVGESVSGAAVQRAGNDGNEDIAAPKAIETEEEEEEGFTEAEEEQMRYEHESRCQDVFNR